MKQKNAQNISALEYINPFETLSVSKRNIDQRYPLHWHNFFEVELIIDGSGTQLLNGTEYALRRGCVYLLSPTDFHEVKPQNGAQITLYNLMFHESVLSEPFFQMLSSVSGNKIVRLSEPDFAELLTICELLKNEYGSAQSYRDNFLRNMLECFLILLCRQLPGLQTLPQSTQKNEMQKALLYLQLHFKDHPTLRETAASIPLHPNYFSQRFKETTGKTYIEYLTHLRLSYAKKLLRATDLSVTEICFASGFSSLSNFLKVFRENAACTPTAYRARQTT